MKPSGIGQTVRFNSHIQSEDGGILSLERGIVVAFSPDRRRCDVVWNDGERGTYRCTDLARMPGTIGDIADSSTTVVGSLTGKVSHQPMRTSPVKDRGHKPVRAPIRITPDSLPRRPDAVYRVSEPKAVKRIILDKPYRDEDGNWHEKSAVKLKFPYVVTKVRADHWSDEDTIRIKVSDAWVRIEYPGKRVDTVSKSSAFEHIARRFSTDVATVAFSVPANQGE